MHSVSDPKTLTAEAIELVQAAAENRGRLGIRQSSKSRGRAVFAGQKAFFSTKDRSVAGQYVEAVRSLVKLQFLRAADARDNYELTNFGWQISRKLS